MSLPVRRIDYGLRDYGTAKWEGGDPNCEHLGKPVPSRAGFNERYFGTPSSDNNKQDALREPMGQVCTKCGAVRIDQQIGLEQTPDEYIANLVAVFRECKRILRDDGTLWVNIGDSYTSMKSRYNQKAQNLNGGKSQDNEFQGNKTDLYHHPELGLKDKDLIGIPWMLAFALRADGWYLRQDIIWAKPNPMPESVKDRCTKSHEYIFLLSKSAKYYYDNEAIMEVATGFDGRKDTKYKGGPKDMAGGAHERWQYKSLETGRTGEVHSGYENPDGSLRVSFDDKGVPVRNKRDVWTVTTSPYKGAHYATFPPKLIEPMILAGCPQIVCAKCGAPYQRVLERVDKRHWTERNDYRSGDKYKFEYLESKQRNEIGRNDAPASFKSPEMIDKGFQPTCNCNAGTTSGIVLDPFVGSGTTIMVANHLGRKGIGLDLNFKYLKDNAKERIGIL